MPSTHLAFALEKILMHMVLLRQSQYSTETLNHEKSLKNFDSNPSLTLPECGVFLTLIFFAFYLLLYVECSDIYFEN